MFGDEDLSVSETLALQIALESSMRERARDNTPRRGRESPGIGSSNRRPGWNRQQVESIQDEWRRQQFEAYEAFSSAAGKGKGKGKAPEPRNETRAPQRQPVQGKGKEKATGVDCMACLDEIAGTVHKLPCKHPYCTPCLAHLIESSMKGETGSFPPTCCKEPVPTPTIKSVISSTDYKKFQDRLADHKGGAKNIFCPIPQCSERVNPVDIKGETGTCPRCGTQVCTKCKRVEHRGVCKENELTGLVGEKGWRGCPACGLMVDKLPGTCNKVSCPCGQVFCYRCGKIQPKDKDLLYRRAADGGGCDCPLWSPGDGPDDFPENAHPAIPGRWPLPPAPVAIPRAHERPAPVAIPRRWAERPDLFVAPIGGAWRPVDVGGDFGGRAVPWVMGEPLRGHILGRPIVLDPPRGVGTLGLNHPFRLGQAFQSAGNQGFPPIPIRQVDPLDLLNLTPPEADYWDQFANWDYEEEDRW